jgi:hypothetical protein
MKMLAVEVLDIREDKIVASRVYHSTSAQLKIYLFQFVIQYGLFTRASRIVW